ncbi:uncharacterized protein KZ484_014082 isoform 2-T2 [Pholidichthys leucotaenia]
MKRTREESSPDGCDASPICSAGEVMSGLLKEIEDSDQKAAATLREESICTDAEIQCLSREDLNGLFPGAENLKLRRKIFDIILQKKPTNDVLKEVRNLVPEESLRAALTGGGILVDYLCLVKDIKTQVNNVTTFFDVHIDLLEEGSKARSLQEPATDKHLKTSKSQTSISDNLQQPQVFLKKICEYDQGAASVLQSHGLSTDADIQSLTQKDLDDLFPEPKYITLKRILHQQKLIDIVLKDLRGFIPLESLNAALTGDGVLVQYKRLLQDNMNKVDNVQNFLKAHLDLLEDISKAQPHQQHAPLLASRLKSSWSTCWSGSKRITVIYKMVVRGKTFDAHQELLNKVKGLCGDTVLDLINRDENTSVQDSQITFVFCPIVSHVGTDVEAALREVPGKEKVILVLMHYTYEAKYMTTLKIWNSNHNVVLCVNVFYFEKKGLLKCPENDKAINDIRKFLKHSIKTP